MIEQRAATVDEVVTTWITAAELFYGAAKSRAPDPNRSVVLRFLDTLPVLDPDRVSAGIFGDLKALLERRGTRVADADLWIGALAASRPAVVVTGNRRHYERMPGVSVEDWIRG